MIEVGVFGAAVWGPGLEGWEASWPVLSGAQHYQPGEMRPPAPAILSANERRRTGLAVRLALIVAQDASAAAGLAPGAVSSVFASSNGDGAVVHAILAALAEPGGCVSPTQFHNSVHNAAAGYWSIATQSRQSATSLGGHDDTFAAGLLNAAAEAAVDRRPVLLAAYDAVLPPPLHAKRPIAFPFGVGLVLGPLQWEGGSAGAGRAVLNLRYVGAAADEAAGRPRAAALRGLASGNPAARSLRLLETAARGGTDWFALPLLDGRVEISVRPW